MNVPKIHVATLIRFVQAGIAAGTTYLLGAKAPSLLAAPNQIKQIDCSGEVRYLLFAASHGALVIPDGSVNQRDWCIAQGLHKLARYADVAQADESRVFICFIPPKRKKSGHVWLVQGGMTIESRFGKGVSRRSWRSLVLLTFCDAAFELPTVPGLSPDSLTTN